MRRLMLFLALLGVGGAGIFWSRNAYRSKPQATVTDIDPKKLFRPRVGAAIPQDVVFRDETGKRLTMGDFGQSRPYILVPAYFRCPSLCNEVLNDLVRALRGIPGYQPGRDYDVVVASFDPKEQPALALAKKNAYTEEFARPGTEHGWHFLTGDQENIDRLLGSIGYTVFWDDAKQQYAHASGLVICSPDGKIARYFAGLDYRPFYLRLALTEAGQGKITPGILDQVLLPCFTFDSSKGRYSAAVLTLVKAAGVVTVLGLLGFWLVMNGRRGAPASVADTPLAREPAAAGRA